MEERREERRGAALVWRGRRARSDLVVLASAGGARAESELLHHLRRALHLDLPPRHFVGHSSRVRSLLLLPPLLLLLLKLLLLVLCGERPGGIVAVGVA